MARVMKDGNIFNSFPVTNGIFQGCILPPMLFSVMFAANCNNDYTLFADDYAVCAHSQEGIQIILDYFIALGFKRQKLCIICS